jgi:endoglucanase
MASSNRALPTISLWLAGVNLAGAEFGEEPLPPAEAPTSTFAYELRLSSNRTIPGTTGGDLWPATWASSGNVYATFGDFSGTSLGLARITGSTLASLAVNYLVGGTSPSVAANWAPIAGYSNTGGILNAKCTSLVASGSSLYLALADDDGNRGWNNCRIGKLSISSLGTSPSVPSWGFGQNHTWKTISPTFLQCGRDFGDAFDEYVYIFSLHYAPSENPDDSPSHTPGRVYLLRCLRSADWQVQANWSWWTGGTDEAPTWGSYASRAPRIELERIDWRPSAHFITPIDRCMFRIGRGVVGTGGGGSQSHFVTLIAVRPWHAWTKIADQRYLASGVGADLAQVSAIPSTIVSDGAGGAEWLDTTWGGTDVDGLGGPSNNTDRLIATRSFLTFSETTPTDVLGTDYIYPTNAEMDYYAGKGFNIFRVPFFFQRIEKNEDRAILLGLVDYASTLGCRVILDPHHYGKIDGVAVSDSAARAKFVAYWSQLADDVQSKGNVIFGLMNEPMAPTVTGGISPAEWLVAANEAIAAIRAQGATQLILVPGSYWTGAHSWVSSGNAAVMNTGVVDPEDNYAFELHQYLDSDYSGTSPTVVTGAGATVLAAATASLRAAGKMAFLGETGVGSSSAALAELEAELDYMDANRDVWIGFTGWAGGPWWYNSSTGEDYFLNLDPIPTLAGLEKPQLTVFKNHIVGVPLPPPSVYEADVYEAGVYD